jgi:GntR family transcriptional repressor for pyruvate dehydrogenase complex
LNIDKQMFEKIESVPLYESIVKTIIEKISAGSLSPGDRLPGERDLAKSFDVSRVVVREALKTLKAMGIVNIFHGRGVFIADTLERTANSLSNLDTNLFQDIWEFRQIMEPRIAEIVAARATDDDLKLIAEIHDSMVKAIKAGNLGITEAISFHKALVKATKNKSIILAFKALNSLMEEAIARVFVDKSISIDALDQHAEIIRALLSRDPSKAFLAMEDHLDRVADTYYSEMNQKNKRMEVNFL